MSKSWQNRIVEYGVKAADQFIAHPNNPKFHPVFQRSVIRDLLGDIGWIDDVIVSLRSGYVLDGHERIWTALERGDGEPVPFHVVDVTEAEESKILATFDPSGWLAQSDPEKLDALLREVNTDSPALQQMLSDLAAQAQMYSNGAGEETPDENPENEPELSRGELLKLVDVTIDEPRHKPEKQDVYTLSGKHVLICAQVVTEWQAWKDYLKGDQTLFCPYPGAFVPLSEKADVYKLVMVQPDLYIAGHILDRYEEIHGGHSISKTSR